MNTTTLNMTTLDGGVIIKRGVSGETINNQDKVIDITENGTTEVVADGGFTGLGKVTINTEVSGGGESASTIEYLDVTNVSESWLSIMLMMSLFVKQQVTLGGVTMNTVLPTLQSQSMKGDMLGVTQIAIDFKATIALSGDGLENIKTVADFIILSGSTQEQLDVIPRITKEQFYTLE